MKAALAQAVDWYVRLHDSAVDERTRADWRSWLAADRQHAEAWRRLEQLQRRMNLASPELAAATLEGARQGRRAALKTLLLLLGVGLAGWQGYRASPYSVDLATGVGERRRLTLADGSRLDLDTDTRVDLRFEDAQRELYLLRGAVRVDAAADARPFSLVSEQGRVQALDGCFSVRQDERTTRVIVERQAVEVLPCLAPEQRARIGAGQSLRFTAAQVGVVEPAPAGADAWTRGMLVAVDWRLADLLAELSRYRPGYLGCAAQIAGLRVSGAYSLDDTDAALEMLEASLPLRTRRLSRLWVRLEPLEENNSQG